MGCADLGEMGMNEHESALYQSVFCQSLKPYMNKTFCMVFTWKPNQILVSGFTSAVSIDVFCNKSDVVKWN